MSPAGGGNAASRRQYVGPKRSASGCRVRRRRGNGGMSCRTCRLPRCPRCGLHLPLCLCARLPHVATVTRVVVIMHYREDERPSNTGRLVHYCLTNSELIRRGRRGAPVAVVAIPRGARPAILYPADDAIPLDRWPGAPPDWLVVPDGSWGQASRIRHGTQGLAGVPCVRLPEMPVTLSCLRAPDRKGRMCTLEAVARALGLLEGELVAAPLLQALTLKVERMLWMRGMLPRAQVTGGIPESAVALVSGRRPA